VRRRAHVPLRTCLGCGQVDRQPTLLRLVRDASGSLDVDRSRRAGGRGGYLHPAPQCWEQFARRKGTVRSFRAAVERAARQALVARLIGGGEG
jgi:hypothetical protein